MSRRQCLLLALAFLPPGAPGVASPRQEPAARKQPPPAAAGSLPLGARARLGGVALRHPGNVEDLAFAPDGKTLAAVGQDGVIRLWDVATGEQRARFPLPEGT